MRTTNMTYRLPRLCNGILTLFLLTCQWANAQYQTYNDAVDLGSNTYQLTPDSANKAGSTWNRVAQNLNYPFSVTGEMFLGQEDAGADGIVFVMQNECVSGGTIGGGIGYNELPGLSLGIEFDTWENTGNGAGNQDNNDPAFDHIGIQAFGNVQHQAAGDSVLMLPQPLRIDSSNVEDSTWHSYEIHWDPNTNVLEVYFEGSLRATLNRDIISDIFMGDSVIYFGFTSSTGGFWANNSVRIDPIPINGASDQYICTGDTAVVDFINNTGGIELISLLKPISASSNEGWPSANEANDGDPGTRWSSQHGNDPEWITIDLLDLYELDSISIQWETAAASDYEIQVSTDSITWLTQIAVNDGVSGETRGFGLSGNYRYVRIYGTARTTGYGYSIWELQIYGLAQIEWTSSPYLQFQGSDRIAFFPPESMPFQVKIPDKCNGPTMLDFWVYVDTITSTVVDRTICLGDSTQLYATVIGNYGDIEYSWDNGLGTSDSVFVTPSNNTIYQVVVEDTVGCQDTSLIRVEVNSPPVLSMTPDTSICFGESIDIEAVGGVQYNWDQGIGISSNSQTISPIEDTRYTVMVSDINSCFDTISVFVEINPLPEVTTTNDTSICSGESITIGANGALDYLWDQSLGLGPTHIVSPVDTIVYSVIGTDINGCENTAQTKVSVSYGSPNPSISLSVDDASVCINDPIEFTVKSSSGLGTSPNYNWYVNNNLVQSGLQNFITSTLISGDIIELRVDNAATCTNIVTITDDTAVVVMDPKPIVEIIDLGYSCDSLKQSFSISNMQDTGSNATWMWNLNGAVVSSNTQGYVLENAMEDDMVDVTLNSSLECAATIKSNQIIVGEPLCDCDIFIPNAISPNGDLANDYWGIQGLDCYDHIVRVYNRYGGLVFESNDYQTPWEGYRNGKPMPVSTYYYVITTISSKGDLKDFTGSLVIMR